MKMLPTEMRAYISNSFVEMWQHPVGEKLTSLLDDRNYAWMTSEGINFRRDGVLSRCSHSEETLARYKALLASKRN